MVYLSDEQRQELVRCVRDAKGRVILLVHPYCTKSVDDIYFTSLNKILSQSKTPLIILEEFSKVNELKRALKASRAKCFVLPTNPYSPALKSRNTPDYGQLDLFAFLKSAGVKKVLLGGQYSNYESQISGLSNSVSTAIKANRVIEHEKKLRTLNPSSGKLMATSLGCAGFTYANLVKHGLDVRPLSRTIYPDRPQYWRKRNLH